MKAGLVGSFAERCDAAQSVADVRALFLSETQALGFPYVACCSHVDPLKPPPGAVTMIHYPQAWLARFSDRNYAARDPVFLAAKRQLLPFGWRERRFLEGLSADQLQILDEAAEAGLGDGLTIPLHAPGALPASCSLVFGPDGVDPLHVERAHWCAVYAHEAARRLLLTRDRLGPALLSPRERQCLELVGRGKDDYAIGVLLGIRESTAHNTVQRTMRKYGVATRIQAVIRAMSDGEIALQDVAN
jgi:DNA-binding CsgD family transcriptional regulator